MSREHDQNQDHDHYVIRGGAEGRERLRVLARVMEPTTRALFERVGVRPGARCLDVGCGGGDVTVELARLVGPEGVVVGTDLDETQLALVRQEAASQGIERVEFCRADVVDDGEVGVFDLVYARFVLTHLPDPAGALAKLHRALRPGGTIIVEDIDHSGFFCDPDSSALWRFLELWDQTAERRGVDPNIGPRLPRLLAASGFAGIQLHVVQPAALTGETKTLVPMTFEAVAPSVLAEGLATSEELNRLVEEVYAFARDPGTVLSMPRVVQTWGQRPAA